MNKKLLMLLLAASVAFVFAASGLQAGSNYPDKISFDTKGFDPDKYEKAEFGHKAHVDTYGFTCGECHHDDKGKALELKVGDNVQKCIECHSNLASDKNSIKLKESYYRAMHTGKESCKGCHREHNKKNNLKSKDNGYAPTTCKKCHEKKPVPK